jgi:phosphoglycerate dehydrogenase-like enzyme
MKESVFFIVVSRGKLVQTEALVTALQEGQIQAAGLDVTDPEPLPADHPLQKMSNVIITPHIAGLSDLNRQRSMELISTNVHRFVRGLPVFNPVDKSAGF